MMLVGLIALAIILWFANSYIEANPKLLVRSGRTAGGVAALAFAAFIGLRGEFAVAIPVALMGFGILGWQPSWLPSWPPWTMPGLGSWTNKAQASRLQSRFVELEVDPNTGAVRGRVVAGRHAGRDLGDLPVADLVALLPEIDDDSRALLAAYLDRRDPAWRQHAQDGAAAGKVRAADPGKMTEQEANQILGLEPGATLEEIGRAHRSLMKKLHPDQGGSTYLAARVNEAKEVLLRRHR